MSTTRDFWKQQGHSGKTAQEGKNARILQKSGLSDASHMDVHEGLAHVVGMEYMMDKGVLMGEPYTFEQENQGKSKLPERKVQSDNTRTKNRK